jgi:hypothetical protein
MNMQQALIEQLDPEQKKRQGEMPEMPELPEMPANPLGNTGIGGGKPPGPLAMPGGMPGGMPPLGGGAPGNGYSDVLDSRGSVTRATPTLPPLGGGDTAPTNPIDNTGIGGGKGGDLPKLDLPGATTNAQPAGGDKGWTMPTLGANKEGPNKSIILGFDADKLADPNSGSAAGSKYTPAAKTFYAALTNGVGVSRGATDGMVEYLKKNGFPNATSDGQQKIDFGDGNGPIDVIRGGDNAVVFQNTTANPVWEAKYGKGGGGGESGGGSPHGGPTGGPEPLALGGGHAPSFGGSSINPMLQGDAMGNIQSALSKFQQPDLLQKLLAQLQQG